MSYTKKVWADDDEITVADLNRWENRAEEIRNKYSQYWVNDESNYVFSLDDNKTFLMGDLISLMNNGITPLLCYNDLYERISYYYYDEVADEVYYYIFSFENGTTFSGTINDIPEELHR